MRKRLNDLTRDSLTIVAAGSEGKLIDASPAARKRGAALVRFMETRESFLTLSDFMTYLEMRAVRRYRITLFPCGVVVFELPAAKLSIMREARLKRSAGCAWVVRPIRWWQRGRRVVDLLPTVEVV